MTSIKYLYSFSSPDFDLVEIKRLDAVADAPVSEVYHWLLIEKKDQVTKLVFEGMGKNGEEEWRKFSQGNLVFNRQEAKLKRDGSTLIMQASEATGLEHAIQAFISSSSGIHR